MVTVSRYFVSAQDTSALPDHANDYNAFCREIIRRVVASSETAIEIATESSVCNLGISDKVSLIQPVVDLANEGTAALGYNYGSADPFRPYLAFYSKMSGADAATSAADETGRHALTFVSGAQLDTAQKSSGVSSLLVSGGYVTVPNHPDFRFGNGDFSIKADVRITSGATTSGLRNFGVIGLTPGTAAASGFGWGTEVFNNSSFGDALYPIDRRVRQRVAVSAGGFDHGIPATFYPTKTFSNSTWHTITASREGNSFYFAVDNEIIWRQSATAKPMYNNTSGILSIGKIVTSADFGEAFPGHIDEVKVYKGVNIINPTDMRWHDQSLQTLMTAIASDETRSVSALPMGAIPANRTVFFDGSRYAERDALLTGVSDGKKITFYACGHFNGSDGDVQRFITTTNARCNFQRLAAAGNSELYVQLRNASNSDIAVFRTSAAYTSDDGNLIVVASVDTSAVTSTAQLYVNGVSDTEITENGGGTIDFTDLDWGIGSTVGGSGQLDGDFTIAMWVDNIDLSDSDNLEKFHKFGNAVEIGVSASIAGLGAPAIFVRGPVGSAAASSLPNYGTGGDFVVKSGTFTEGLPIRVLTK